MSKQRVIRVSPDQPNYAVCVMGTEISLDVNGCAPSGATSVDVQGTADLKVNIIYNPKRVTKPVGAPRWPLDSDVEITVAIHRPSSTINDNQVRVSYYGPPGEMLLANAWLYLTCVAVSLDADTSRSGVVEKNAKNKTKWTWGPDGEGAILLVNCDRDGPSSEDVDSTYPYVRSYADLQDMSPVILTVQGPKAIFANHQLLLHVSMRDAANMRVFYASGNISLCSYKHILGSDKLSYAVEKNTDGKEQSSFFVEGLAFPDVNFSGLVSLNATLLEVVSSQNSPDIPVFTDTVVFRVAPWMMTPNTLKPLEVFVCRKKDNADFVQAVKALTEESNCKLTICPVTENQNDPWIQDQMEFGYVEAPHKFFPVVFNSPRKRGLKNFPFKKILGRDFGYVTREPENEEPSTLDSFGNLEISPPVTVRGKEYPLGRILFGSGFPGTDKKRMVKIIRDFIYAQKVQSPIELFSAWLLVGHVDEFLSFVPAPDKKGFRLLLASPLACYKLFKEKKEEGYGDAAALFEGLENVKRVTVNEILADEALYRSNKYAQDCIDRNRSILKQELGLSECDIIDIPQLFTPGNSSGMLAFFPNMVNMLVLGKHLGIPKPFGPIVTGCCCLETKVISLLEPLGLTCTFIDDFFFYHQRFGDVHCGTNVRREPFPFHWWNIVL